MKKRFSLFLFAIVFLSNSLFSTIYLVENSASRTVWRVAGVGETNVSLNGTALNAWYTSTTLETGDQVWIAAGTYILTASIVPKGGESIYGGFLGTETTLSERIKGANAWDFTNATILDGNSSNFAVFWGTESQVNTTLIDGFTIQNGYQSVANKGGGAHLLVNTTMQNCVIKDCKYTNTGTAAGGVSIAGGTLQDSYIYNNFSNKACGGVMIWPASTLKRCTIEGNIATTNAGGIYIFNSGADGSGCSIEDCKIINNKAVGNAAYTGQGGGILVFTNTTIKFTTQIVIKGCTITGNVAGYASGTLISGITAYGAGLGGGIHINDANSTNGYLIEKCNISNNSAISGSGGISLSKSLLTTIRNSVISNNKGTTALIAVAGVAAPTIQNSTFASNVNVAGDAKVGITLSHASSASILTNCLFYDCTTSPITATVAPTTSYCGFESGVTTPAGATNLVTISSASFVDATNTTTSLRNYNLAASSGAIDAGTTIAACSPDIEGVDRPQWSNYDMGAYEYNKYTWDGTNSWSNTANWSPAILPNSTSAIVVNSGVLTQDQNATLKSLTVNSGATLNVNANKELTVTTDLTNNGTLNLLSSATGTATLLTQGTVSAGTYNVNQALTSYRSWYMSSPVSNATPAGMNRIKYYNEADNTWPSLYDVNSVPFGANYFVKGKGYLVVPDNDDTNILFTGTINTGTIPVDVSVSTSTNPSKAGYNLVGNPYPSYLDWTAVYAANSAKLANSTMWYRTKSGSYTFWTVNGTSGEGSPATATKNIAPTQAFWVKAIATDQLSFTNAMRVPAPADNKLLKAPARTNVETSRLRLQLSNAESTDETVLYFNENASNVLDAYDSPKKSNEDETISEIYTSLGNQQIVINGMKTMPLDQEIALGFLAGSATNFSIKANEVTNFASDVKVILKDNITLEETDLTDGISSYNFTLNSSSANRFALIFRTPSVTTKLSTVSDANFLAYSVDAGQIVLQIKNAETETKQVYIYNSVGQCLVSQNLSTDVTVINAQFKAGMYVVKVNNAIRKVIVK